MHSLLGKEKMCYKMHIITLIAILQAPQYVITLAKHFAPLSNLIRVSSCKFRYEIRETGTSGLLRKGRLGMKT
jgi:hypothetical protein